MFTGIIKHSGIVVEAQAASFGKRLIIEAPDLIGDAHLSNGASVAIDGVCLTVAELTDRRVSFDVIPETLRCSTLGAFRKGLRVNLEPSLRAGDAVDGHFVQGHVDGTATVTKRDTDGGEYVVWFEVESQLTPYLIPKGSITIDGVSFTIAAVKGETFCVAVIPTTLELTNLGERKVGDRVNIESDVITRTIVHRLNAVTGETGLTQAKQESQGAA